MPPTCWGTSPAPPSEVALPPIARTMVRFPRAIASAISEVGDMSGLPSLVKQITHAPLDEKLLSWTIYFANLGKILCW